MSIKWQWRRRSTGLMGVCAAASILVAAGAAQSPGAARAAALGLSSVVTPAPIAAKAMGCEQEQLNVNTAGVADLVALGLGRPVAERVVAHREPMYLDLEDLLSVEGIGPDELRQIIASGKACAELPSTPPPVDAHVCRPGDGRIDLNRPSSESRLAAMFGGPTSARIVAGIPYAGVLPAIAEHVPGVGKGKLQKLLQDLCATPATIDSRGVRWGWISTAGGRVDHPAKATLTVPMNTIDAPGGLWGSVRPMAFDELFEGPTFDLALHGPWTDADRTVYATLPADPFLPTAASAAGFTPAILHYGGEADNPDVHALSAVDVGDDGRWSAALTSLSPVEARRVLTSFVENGIRSLEDLVLDLVKDVAVGSYEPPACSPDASDERRLQVTLDPDSLATGGFGGFVRPIAKWCAEGDPAGGSLRFQLSNAGFPSFGLRQHGGPAEVVDVKYSANISMLSRAVLELYNRDLTKELTYGPGTSVVYDLPASPATNQVDVVRSALEYPDIPLVDTVLVLTENLGAIPQLETPDAVLNCIKSLTPGFGIDSIVSCIQKAAETGGADDVARSLKALGRGLTGASLVRGATDALAATGTLMNRDFEGSVFFRFRPVLVAAPGQPSIGDPAQAKGSRILKRKGSSAAFILDEAGVARHIPTGQIYECAARVLPVQFNVDDAEFAAQVTSVGEDATCPAGPARVLSDRAVPGGFLIRRTDGTTFLTRQIGEISYLVPLFSGQSVFDCMSEKHLTWDLASFDELSNFDNHPSEAATVCGL